MLPRFSESTVILTFPRFLFLAVENMQTHGNGLRQGEWTARRTKDTRVAHGGRHRDLPENYHYWRRDGWSDCVRSLFTAHTAFRSSVERWSTFWDWVLFSSSFSLFNARRCVCVCVSSAPLYLSSSLSLKKRRENRVQSNINAGKRASKLNNSSQDSSRGYPGRPRCYSPSPLHCYFLLFIG